MKQKKSILLSLLILLLYHSGFAQELSKNVLDFVHVQDSIVAITNVTIIDGTGGAIKYNQDIVISGSYISAMGESGHLLIPESAHIIDGTDQTLIPGLIMMHEHLIYARPVFGMYKAVHMTHTFPQMYLAGGLTTMRTAGSLEANADLNIRNFIEEGKRIGPTMDVSTPHIEREGLVGEFIPQLQSLYGDENIEDWLSYWFEKGVGSVKAYNNFSKDDLREIIRVSDAWNIKVTGHLCSVTYREAAEMGIDNLEHGFMAATDFVEGKKENECVSATQSLRDLDDNDPDLIALMNLLIEKNVTLTYTPNVFEPFTGREIIPGGGHVALAPYLLEQMQNIYNKNVNSKSDSLSTLAFEKEKQRIMKFHSLGGKITVGTDPTGTGKTIAGYANLHLIELLIETGFNIEEAIKLSSYNGAEYLGILSETGTIEQGKQADLVLIDGDLAEDVSNIRKVKLVFKDGVGYDSKKIFDSVKGKVGLY